MRERVYLALILIYFVITAGAYAYQTPLFEASDEAEHVIYVDTLLKTGALPIIQNREQMANQTDPILRWNNQSHHAPLYYMTSALLVGWSSRADLADYLHPNELIFLRNTPQDNPNKWLHRYQPPRSDSHRVVYALRAFNSVIGIMTLLMIYGAARQLQTETALLVTLFTASIPTFVIVNSSVTNDALVIFFYSAGIYACLRWWRHATITNAETLLLSLIVAAAALTKLTGLSLLGVVYGTLILGVWRGRWCWQVALRVMLIVAGVTLLLTGWWYMRNLQLYGDLFAMRATGSIWGRETPFTWALLPDELLRIAKSFWMMIGYLHFPVYAPDAFYGYVGALVGGSLLGWGAWLIRRRWNNTNAGYGIALLACAIVAGMVLYGTRSVDISYGRLLHPALAAFVPLLIIGIWQWLRRWTWALVVPLSLVTLVIPFTVIPDAYPSLVAVDSLPQEAIPINWRSDDLEVLAITLPTVTLTPGDHLPVTLYFRGNHPLNPALTLTLVDSVRVARLDHIEQFPGMADMRVLPPHSLYRADFTLHVPPLDDVRAPRLSHLLLEWVDLDSDETLTDASGNGLLDIVAVPLHDPAYQVPSLGNSQAVNFGAGVILRDFSLPTHAQAGETIPIQLVWEPQTPLTPEASLTIQLFDDDNTLRAQSDGVLWWYPTTHWLIGVPFEDQRQFDLPSDLPTGVYEVRVGWYQRIGNAYPRLALAGGADDLYILPQSLTITAE